MTTTALVLILVSVVLHVAWNLFFKRGKPTAAFFLAANTAGALGFTPFLLAHGARLGDLPASVWGLLAATGGFQAVYMIALAGAYERGELSVAYPLVRGTAPAFVALGGVALGRTDSIGTACAAGIGLILAGGVLLPLERFRLTRRELANASLGFALVGACATAGYTLVDDRALALLRGLAEPLGPTSAALLYAPLEAWSASLALSLYVLGARRERAELARVLAGPKTRVVGVGLCIYASYVLVLVAFAHVEDVSYAAAFRQVSVPLGALVGIRFLRERTSNPKLAGIALTTVGLLLVVLG